MGHENFESAVDVCRAETASRAYCLLDNEHAGKAFDGWILQCAGLGLRKTRRSDFAIAITLRD